MIETTPQVRFHPAETREEVIGVIIRLDTRRLLAAAFAAACGRLPCGVRGRARQLRLLPCRWYRQSSRVAG